VGKNLFQFIEGDSSPTLVGASLIGMTQIDFFICDCKQEIFADFVSSVICKNNNLVTAKLELLIL